MLHLFRWITTDAEPSCADDGPKVLVYLAGWGPEVRSVRRVGERFYAPAFENSDEHQARLLPGGKVADGPSYFLRWEPLSPPDWQPGSETAHEQIARLEAEKAEAERQLAEARSHSCDLKRENADLRLRLHALFASTRAVTEVADALGKALRKAESSA